MEIGDEQFAEEKGTHNATYALITLTEWTLGAQRDLSVCFTDYTKANDEAKHG